MGFSALSVFLNLHAPGCGAEHGQVPWVHAMHTSVVGPANKPSTQGRRKALKGCAVPWADAPGATQYQGDCRVGLEHRLQEWNPFEQRMSCSLIRAHVDALAWMPEHFFMVNNAIEIEVQDDVRAAWSGRREIWGNLARGQSHMLGLDCAWWGYSQGGRRGQSGLRTCQPRAYSYENAPDWTRMSKLRTTSRPPGSLSTSRGLRSPNAGTTPTSQ